MARTFYIPADSSQITVKQFVAFHLAKTDVERAMIAANAKRKDVEALKLDAVLDLINLFEDSMKTGAARHEQTFFVNKKRLGFIPDFNELSFKEHVELDTYAQAIFTKDGQNYKELPNLLAVLFRPVHHILGKYYTLREYDSDQVKTYIDDINELTMDRVSGALVFFSTIASELANNSLEFLEEMREKMTTELTRLQADSPDGVGSIS
jgi:hypothetical protein